MPRPGCICPMAPAEPWTSCWPCALASASGCLRLGMAKKTRCLSPSWRSGSAVSKNPGIWPPTSQALRAPKSVIAGACAHLHCTKRSAGACVEAANRDEKTGVILREGGDDHKLTSLRHLHRLLLANLCLHWLAALAGLQAYHDLAEPQTVAPALETVAPNCLDLDLLDHGPAQPPPVVPHRGP